MASQAGSRSSMLTPDVLEGRPLWLDTECHVARRQALLGPSSTPHAFGAHQNNRGADHGMRFDRLPENEIGKGDGADRNQVMERADGERSQ